MDISIHEAERLERRGRRFVAATILGAITIIAASWIGLMAFLSANSAFGTVGDLRETWIPDVEALTLDLPDLTELSELYTTDGVLLGKLTERNSQPLPLDDIPNLVIGAVLAAEDAEYMEHGGIDYEAIIRALVRDLGGGPTQGGSTITQQVVKQNFVGSEPTLERKVTEAAIAIELERRYTKEQILEFYLNSVYFGNNAYGINAAAQEYFDKPLDALTIAEAAALPVPIRNPSLYDLRRDSEIPLRARDAVIAQMVEEGYITADEGETAKDEPLDVAPSQEFEELAPQVLIAARDEVLNDPRFGLGETFLQRKRALFGCPAEDVGCEGGGGLKIFTTVDFGLQQQAQQILQEWFPPGEEGPTGAIAMVDNRTGATVVMASGIEFGDDIEAGQRQYDLATRGRRNPGSAFKPFGLIAALEDGIPLRSYWDITTPQVIDFGGSEDWECNNAGLNEPGIKTLEQATVDSTNAVFCQVAVEVGAGAIAEVAQRLGIRSPLENVPSIVLGTSAVTPLEMASAYSTIANLGDRVDNHLIDRIEDADGNVIYQHEVVRTPTINRALAAAVLNTLERTACCGTGWRSELEDERPWAGKTGTHENSTDVWFMGFVPQYTTSVWVGFPDAQIEMKGITINGEFYRQAFGGTLAAPIWKQFMDIVVTDLPVLDFPPNPEGVNAYYATPRVEIPDVIGLDFEEAQEELFQAGLDVDIKVVNSTEDEDTVVATNPEVGDRVRQGTIIEIEVSNGLPPEIPMPRLTDQTQDQAEFILTALRDDSEIPFTWFFSEEIVENPAFIGRVVRTDPPVGGVITEDTIIELVIGIADPNPNPNPPGNDD